jgi:hypothetical protein
MRQFTAVILFFLCTAGLWAQTHTEEIFRHPLEPRTMNVFISICSRLAEHPFTRGNFDQEKTISRLNRSLKSFGGFVIASGRGMVWDIAKPFPSTLTLGKDYLIQSRRGGEKTVLSAQGNETFLQMAEVINAVFSGNSRELLDNFEVYLSGTETSWELGLSPKNTAIGSFAQKIIIKGDTAIKSIIIYEQNGDTIQYTLYNHSYPAELNVYEKAFFVLP